MINYQENKHVIFSGFLTIVVFIVLYFLNFQSLNDKEYFGTNLLSYSFQGVYFFFTFVILPSSVFILLQIILLKYLNLFLLSLSFPMLGMISNNLFLIYYLILIQLK